MYTGHWWEQKWAWTTVPGFMYSEPSTQSITIPRWSCHQFLRLKSHDSFIGTPTVSSMGPGAREGMNRHLLMLKLHYFGHLMWRANSLAPDQTSGKRKRDREWKLILGWWATGIRALKYAGSLTQPVSVLFNLQVTKSVLKYVCLVQSCLKYIFLKEKA